MPEQYIHSELTGRIIGCAMEVHRTLGSGVQEGIYQRALAIEMTQQALEFSREHPMKIYFKGTEIGDRRVDFFVEETVMVEGQIENQSPESFAGSLGASGGVDVNDVITPAHKS